MEERDSSSILFVQIKTRFVLEIEVRSSRRGLFHGTDNMNEMLDHGVALVTYFAPVCLKLAVCQG